MQRPTVDFPEPLSPTSPSVSPCWIENETPFTACTSSRECRAGNALVRPWTSMSGGIDLRCQMALGGVAVAHRLVRRLLGPADQFSPRTALLKAAPAEMLQETRGTARRPRDPQTRRSADRVEQRDRVRVPGVLQQSAGHPELDHLPGEHDRDPVTIAGAG